MSKTMQASRRIMTVPVWRTGQSFRVKLTGPDDFLWLDIPAVAPENADFIAQYPLPWPPETTAVEADAEFFAHVGWRDAQVPPPDVMAEPRRQQFHFTPARGWLNDPNGLYWKDGEWHLFHQYNPFGTTWGNMHWAHAVSTDLIHWQETGITLYPDAYGTMFSGCAVIDDANVSGLGASAILLYYTNAGYEKPATQNLAYSTDGGKSFHKYAGNPLIPTISGACDRDPVIAYDPEAEIWRMCLYFDRPGEHRFLLFDSTDLLHWRETDSYVIPGGAECPGMCRLRDEVTGLWKWVFFEADCHYRVGTIRDGKVRMETEARKFLYGDGYAGQLFYGAPGPGPVWLGWLRMPGGAGRTYSGAMTLPLRFGLGNNILTVRPYALPERPETTIAIAGGVTIRCGGQTVKIDPAGRKLQLPGQEDIPFPPELSVPSGQLFVDRMSLEYYDDSGRFAFAIHLADTSDLKVEPV